MVARHILVVDVKVRILMSQQFNVLMVELVDTYALGAYAVRCVGSSPTRNTNDLLVQWIEYDTTDVKI